MTLPRFSAGYRLAMGYQVALTAAQSANEPDEPMESIGYIDVTLDTFCAHIAAAVA